VGDRRGAKLHLFGQLKRITEEWLDCLVCKGGTYRPS